MAEHGTKRGAVRQAISSLLRLAHDDARDARTLAEAGGTRNAASLLHSAISRLIEAVVASEQGYAGPPEIRRISAENPLKERLLQLDAFPAASPAIQWDGRLAEPPSTASVLAPLDDLTATLEHLLQHFGVDLQATGPARTADPLRPEVQASPPPPQASPSERSSKAIRRQLAGPQPAQSKLKARAAATLPEPATLAVPPPLQVNQAETQNLLAGMVRGHVAARELGLPFVVGARLQLADGAEYLTCGPPTGGATAS
jgi:hypothetical protein